MGRSCLPVFFPGEEGDHAFSCVLPVDPHHPEQLELFSSLELWAPSQVGTL